MSEEKKEVNKYEKSSKSSKIKEKEIYFIIFFKENKKKLQMN